MPLCYSAQNTNGLSSMLTVFSFIVVAFFFHVSQSANTEISNQSQFMGGWSQSEHHREEIIQAAQNKHVNVIAVIDKII